MKKVIMIRLVWMATIVLVIATLAIYEYVWSERLPHLEVSPVSTTLGPYPAIDQEFDISVLIKNLTSSKQLVGVEFKLGYNSSLLELVNVTEGPFLQDPRWNWYGTFFPFFQEPDYILVDNILLPNSSGIYDQTEFSNGDGAVAIFRFKVIYQGFFPQEDISPLNLFDIQFVDLDGVLIPHAPPANGTVKILGKPEHADVTLFNEQIQIVYTDEAAAIASYMDDTKEPTGWELLPSVYWDSNKNGEFEANETIGHTIAPSVHFTYNDQTHLFWPLYQSIVQDPGDPHIISSGWITYPNVYRSKVEDPAKLITIESTISVFDGNSFFAQDIKITSTATFPLTNVTLTTYIGIDINGPFNDYAFIDTSQNMLKACNNETGIWFGAHPQLPIHNFEISEWNDGPYEANDLWQHMLNNVPDETNASWGDIEGALKFDLNQIQPGESKSLTIHYSLGMNETDLYVPHDLAVTNITPSKKVVGQGYSTLINVTVKNQGGFTETFNVIVSHDKIANPTPTQWDDFWSIGDVNRNGYIDEVDAEIIQASFGSYPGHPRWNPDADINSDGKVGIADAYICESNFGLDIWTYYGLSPPPIGKKTITLTSGNSTTVTLIWNTTGFAKGNYTITAKATPLPSETDITDNNFTDGWVIVAMVGDITGGSPNPWDFIPDGKVDITDVAVTAMLFGVNYPDPDYETNCDINNDLKIDIFDVAIVAKHFGEIDP